MTKTNKTFSLDQALLTEIKRTKGAQSESQRVNSLLRFALDLERRAALYKEAAGFFGRASADRRERKGYESASLPSWTRE